MQKDTAVTCHSTFSSCTSMTTAMQESTARPVNTPAAILCHLPALQHNVYVEVRIRTTYVFYIMWYRSMSLSTMQSAVY